MKKSSIIWGTILIIIGLLVLLRSFDVIYFSWWSFWRLWPVILILIGISVIPMKEWIKVTLTIIVIAASVVLVVRPNDGQHKSSCIHYFGDWNFDDEDWNDLKDEIKDELKKINESNYVTRFDDDVTKVVLNVELTDCDAFAMKKYNKNGLSFETVGTASFNLTTTTDGNVANCSLTPMNPESENDITKADLLLSPKFTYALNIKTKSEYNNFDFSEISVSELNLTAIDDNNLWNIKFGDKYSPAKVNLTTNDELEKVEISIPKSIGISFSAPDLTDVSDWNKLNKTGDIFVSDNFETATVKIEIIADKIKDVAFEIKRY